MDRNEIEAKARTVVTEHLGVEDDKVTADAKFMDDLGADSLDAIELTMGFEETFGIEIPDDAQAAWNTFGDAVAGIEKIVNA